VEIESAEGRLTVPWPPMARDFAFKVKRRSD